MLRNTAHEKSDYYLCFLHMKSSSAYKYSNVSLPSNSVCHGHLPLCLFSMNPESRTLTPNFHCLSSKCFAFLSWRFHALSSTCSTKIKSKSMTFPPPMPYFFTSLFLHTDLHLPLSAGNSDKKMCPSLGFHFFPLGTSSSCPRLSPFTDSRIHLLSHHTTALQPPPQPWYLTFL